MPVRQIAPQPVNFTPDKVTQVNIQVPCNINNIDITTVVQTLQNQIAALTARIAVLERKTANLP
jgi:hypothetical protein